MRILQLNSNQKTKERIFERILREGKDYYDPFFSGADCINDEFWDDQPVRLEGADLDEFLQGLFDFAERERSFDKCEFKEWCISKGLDWDVTSILMRQIAGAAADAYNTSVGLY